MSPGREVHHRSTIATRSGDSRAAIRYESANARSALQLRGADAHRWGRHPRGAPPRFARMSASATAGDCSDARRGARHRLRTDGHPGRPCGGRRQSHGRADYRPADRPDAGHLGAGYLGVAGTRHRDRPWIAGRGIDSSRRRGWPRRAAGQRSSHRVRRFNRSRAPCSEDGAGVLRSARRRRLRDHAIGIGQLVVGHERDNDAPRRRRVPFVLSGGRRSCGRSAGRSGERRRRRRRGCRGRRHRWRPAPRPSLERRNRGLGCADSGNASRGWPRDVAPARSSCLATRSAPRRVRQKTIVGPAAWIRFEATSTRSAVFEPPEEVSHLLDVRLHLTGPRGPPGPAGSYAPVRRHRHRGLPRRAASDGRTGCDRGVASPRAGSPCRTSGRPHR